METIIQYTQKKTFWTVLPLASVLKHWVQEIESFMVVYENTTTLSSAITYFNLFLCIKISQFVCLKSLSFLDEAEHQYERSPVRHTETHLGVPCTYSNALATSHAQKGDRDSDAANIC